MLVSDTLAEGASLGATRLEISRTLINLEVTGLDCLPAFGFTPSTTVDNFGGFGNIGAKKD